MPIQSVDSTTLNAWLNTGKALLIDVREPIEYRTESIPRASLLPLDQVSLQALSPQREKKIVLHCRSGGRSRKACEILYAQDSSLELYNLEGGMISWKQAGFPTQTQSWMRRLQHTWNSWVARIPWNR